MFTISNIKEVGDGESHSTKLVGKIDYEEVFVKYFLNVSSSIFDGDLPLDQENVGCISYELMIHRDIIKSLVDNKISPNFVKNKMTLEDQSIDVLENIYEPRLVKKKCLNLLKKSNVSKDDLDITTKDLNNKNIKIDFIVNRRLSMYILADFLYDNIYRRKKWWKVFLQLLAACKTMKYAKLTHNDLHSGNISVEKFDGSVKYVFDDYNVLINNVDDMPVIFDFDRSYAPQLGNNYLDEYDCYQQDNKFSSESNYLFIVCNFAYIFYNKDRKIFNYFVSAINMNGKYNFKPYFKRFLKSYKKTYSFFGLCDGHVDLHDENNINSLPSLDELITCAVKKSNSVFNSDVECKNTYTCKKDMFDDDGKVVL